VTLPFWLIPFLLSASMPRATALALDPPNQPDLVTVVPFQLYDGFILLSAEVDGHRGTFLLDTGSPRIFLNSQYLRRGHTGGIDTSAAPTVPQFTPRMTVPLVPEPGVELASGVVLGKGNGWSIVGHLGDMPDTLMVDTGSPDNSISRGTRQKLVAHLTPARADMTRQFKEVYTRMAKLQGIQAPPQPSLWIVDHLMVAGHAFDALPFAEDYVEDLLGYPFLSQGGVIGFNIRAHQLIFYR